VLPLWVYGLLVALAALVAWLIIASWRDRQIDFLHDVVVGADVEAVRESLLDHQVPILVSAGFSTAAHVAHTTILEHRYFPGWTLAVAVLFFPVGLLALLARRCETITIASSGDTLRVHGTCHKQLADWVVEDVDRIVGVRA
jgi:hypothetical protein